MIGGCSGDPHRGALEDHTLGVLATSAEGRHVRVVVVAER